MKPIDILLVEDNEGDILLTTEALLESKVANSVQIVKNGYDALKFLRKEDEFAGALTPDLILLDINLPKINGLEVLKQIKSIEQLNHIPVIILSTSSSYDDVLKSYQSYASSFITKPVDANDYNRVIKSIQSYWAKAAQIHTLHLNN